MATNRAAERAKARQAIERILERVSLQEDRISVLQDILYEIECAERKPQAARRKGRQATTEPNEAAEQAAVQSVRQHVPLWQMIESHCRNSPTLDGRFDYTAVGRAVFPGLDPQKARALVYSSVFRRSEKSDRGCDDPRFEVTGNGFRLLERDPEAIAREGP